MFYDCCYPMYYSRPLWEVRLDRPKEDVKKPLVLDTDTFERIDRIEYE